MLGARPGDWHIEQIIDDRRNRTALFDTGRQRNRVFAYDQYLSILNEGTERPKVP